MVGSRVRRQMLNNVWKQFTKLGSPVTSNLYLENEFSRSVVEVGEFETPQAANTTVLVTGATGRWGPCPVSVSAGPHVHNQLQAHACNDTGCLLHLHMVISCR